MKKNSDFFERILEIARYENFRSINDFAINGLGYKASEKINRLKNEENKPSMDIILDISNKFENIDLHWLLTGEGEMLKGGDVVRNRDGVVANRSRVRDIHNDHSINVNIPEKGYQKIINSEGKEVTIEARGLDLSNLAELETELQDLRAELYALKEDYTQLMKKYTALLEKLVN